MVRIIIYSVVIVIVFFLIAIKWITSQAALYQTELGSQLREEFGFSHGSPYIQSGTDKVEVFTIYPKPNSFMHDVGFSKGDIIVSESITGFYKLLYKSKGKKVSVNTVSGGDGPPLVDREVKTLTFHIPNGTNSKSE